MAPFLEIEKEVKKIEHSGIRRGNLEVECLKLKTIEIPIDAIDSVINASRATIDNIYATIWRMPAIECDHRFIENGEYVYRIGHKNGSMSEYLQYSYASMYNTAACLLSLCPITETAFQGA